MVATKAGQEMLDPNRKPPHELFLRNLEGEDRRQFEFGGLPSLAFEISMRVIERAKVGKKWRHKATMGRFATPLSF